MESAFVSVIPSVPISSFTTKQATSPIHGNAGHHHSCDRPCCKPARHVNCNGPCCKPARHANCNGPCCNPARHVKCIGPCCTVTATYSDLMASTPAKAATNTVGNSKTRRYLDAFTIPSNDTAVSTKKTYLEAILAIPSNTSGESGYLNSLSPVVVPTIKVPSGYLDLLVTHPENRKPTKASAAPTQASAPVTVGAKEKKGKFLGLF